MSLENITFNQLHHSNRIENCFLAGLAERTKKQVFQLRNYIPAIRNKINQELDSINQTFTNETIERMKEVPYVLKLPEDGVEPTKILENVKQYVQLGKRERNN